MRIDDINQLKSILLTTSIQSVCILDNNSIEFLLRIEDSVNIKRFFSSYDLVLLPNWVQVEVNDSPYRTRYINDVSNLECVYFYSISEYGYLDLVDGRDCFLFILFQEICKTNAALNGFLNRHVLKGNPIEDLPEYEEWLELFYNNAFESSTLKNGRIRKKNAGEISIAVLAFILSKFYSVNHITVISQDAGTYEMIRRAEPTIVNKIPTENDNPITFKSNDFIINEFFKLGYLESKVNNELSKLRNPRKVKYIILKEDNSIEERHSVIDNYYFIELLQNKSLQIIF